MLKLYYRNKNRKSDISNISGREISKKTTTTTTKKNSEMYSPEILLKRKAVLLKFFKFC